MRKIWIFALLPLLLLACNPSGSPATGGKTPPSDGEKFPATPPGVISWTGSAGRSFTGTFDKWKIAEFNVPGGDFSKVKAKILVDIASVNVDPDGLENHLRADDYLDAKGHPIATITLDGATGQKKTDTYMAPAKISLKGVEQEVNISFEVDRMAKPFRIKGSSTVLRESHKVGDDEGVNNEVPITFNFAMPPQ